MLLVVLRRAKTADVLRVPTVDSSQPVNTKETKSKRNGVQTFVVIYIQFLRQRVMKFVVIALFCD